MCCEAAKRWRRRLRPSWNGDTSSRGDGIIDVIDITGAGGGRPAAEKVDDLSRKEQASS